LSASVKNVANREVRYPPEFELWLSVHRRRCQCIQCPDARSKDGVTIRAESIAQDDLPVRLKTDSLYHVLVWPAGVPKLSGALKKLPRLSSMLKSVALIAAPERDLGSVPSELRAFLTRLDHQSTSSLST
jgi:hypothetical protein